MPIATNGPLDNRALKRHLPCPVMERTGMIDALGNADAASRGQFTA